MKIIRPEPKELGETFFKDILPGECFILVGPISDSEPNLFMKVKSTTLYNDEHIFNTVDLTKNSLLCITNNTEIQPIKAHIVIEDKIII